MGAIDVEVRALDWTDPDLEWKGDRTAYRYDARAEPRSLYHGPHTVEDWVKWARRWVRQDRHLPLGIVGPPGNGKSGFGIQLSKKLDEKYDVVKQTAFGENNTMRLAKRIGKYRVARGDEGDKSGNKLATMHSEAIELAEEMDHIRKLNSIPIFTRPDFADFIKGLADHLHWLFDINRRGWFVAYEVFSLGIKKKTVLLVARFEGPFGDCAVNFPDDWNAYMALAMRYAGDEDPGATRAFEETVMQYERIIRRELPWKLREIPA